MRLNVENNPFSFYLNTKAFSYFTVKMHGSIMNVIYSVENYWLYYTMES